jgi:hypothetical protein
VGETEELGKNYRKFVILSTTFAVKLGVTLLLLLLLLLLLSAIELSLGGSSPYTSTDKTIENKYT